MSEELAEKPGRFQLPLAGVGRVLWRGFLQGLTPAHCLVCRASVQEASTLCVGCWQKLALVEMPVCQEVYRVLAGEIPASEAYRGLSRQVQAGHEREPG